MNELSDTVLRQIGLTEGESRTYLALLRLGASTAGPLTDKAVVSRSKIYHILERLMQKGLVSYIVVEKTRRYVAEPPSKVADYLAKREEELKSQEQQLRKLMPILEAQQHATAPHEAQIYRGFKGVQTVHEHTYKKLARGGSYFYMGVPALTQSDKQRDWYWQKDQRRAKAGITCRLLFNQQTEQRVLENRNKVQGCDARYFPLPIETPSWILGYADVTVVGFVGDEPLAIEITNPGIAKSFHSYFDSFWQLSKKLKKR